MSTLTHGAQCFLSALRVFQHGAQAIRERKRRRKPMTASMLSSTRRDAIHTLALGFAGVGSLAALWPFVDQMNPNGSSPRDIVEVDLGGFDVAHLKLVQRKGQPIFIRYRTSEEIAIARRISLAFLIDPFARVTGLGEKEHATDDNRTKAGHREWLVVVGARPRCACLLKDGRAAGFDAVDAFFCACCGSRFDVCGRVSVGPALTNLAVPAYRFIAPARIEIGL
jgi:ubiquinol-cytochrome c reductase iron-sulfur subunit